jgi:hypothetical protein
MGKYRHIKISLMLFFLAVIGVSLSSCMIFFMGDFREFLIDEDFNDGVANNWMPDVTAGIFWWVDAGEYLMDGSSALSQYTYSSYNEPGNDRFDDFVLEVTVTQYTGDTGANQCGLFFRGMDPTSLVSWPNTVMFEGYTFGIMDNGTWYLDKWTNAGFPSSLGTGLSAAINTGSGQKNLLKVYCRGDTIKIYINDVYITTVYDGYRYDGWVGLYAQESGGPGNSFGFDNFRLWLEREWNED